MAAAELALAKVLPIGAGLLIQTFPKFEGAQLGFDPQAFCPEIRSSDQICPAVEHTGFGHLNDAAGPVIRHNSVGRPSRIDLAAGFTPRSAVLELIFLMVRAIAVACEWRIRRSV